MLSETFPGLVSPPQTAALVCVINRWETTGHVTVRDVAATIGRSASTTHVHLKALKRRGLIRWEPGKAGTLRPAVRIVVTL